MFETIFSTNSLGRALSQMDPFVNLCPPMERTEWPEVRMPPRPPPLPMPAALPETPFELCWPQAEELYQDLSGWLLRLLLEILSELLKRSMIKVWKFISIVIEIKRLVCSSCCFWSIKKQLAMTSASIGNPPKAVSAFGRRSSLTGLGVCFVHMSVGTWFNLCIPNFCMWLNETTSKSSTEEWSNGKSHQK